MSGPGKSSRLVAKHRPGRDCCAPQLAAARPVGRRRPRPRLERLLSNPFNAGLGGMYKKWATAVVDATDLVLVYTNWGGSLIGSAAPVGAPIYVRAGVGNDVDVYPATFFGGTVSEVTISRGRQRRQRLVRVTDPIPLRIYAGQRFPVGTYVRVDQLVGTGDTHTNTTIDNFVPTSGRRPLQGPVHLWHRHPRPARRSPPRPSSPRASTASPSRPPRRPRPPAWR
jgi:hypothetical protein